ncbi:DUF2927 domain-containing protein [Rhodophyticola sp. CCM32]|uniref:DUF2927 domain-containing protein n=1 Tax=Rhodophyticola sp. CCM32 TaxID=2916397 RepID=UPI00107F956E|nr:DUF2927 domain-containing protein [Rhodophyticola sp. CCM32]QBX99721.1 DUF2927 domain-containing protein [Rhodophyticola sp. CCM32]
MVLTACNPSQFNEMPERRDANSQSHSALPPMAQFSTRAARATTRSNTAIAQDILDLSFMMESGRPITHLSRFEGPITVTVAPGAPASLGPDLDRLLNRLRREARIDITRVAPGGETSASITIETLPRSRMQRVVPKAACFVVPRQSSWDEFRHSRNSQSLDWTTLTTRERVAVFIPSDVAPQEIRDCLHEEIGQAIGPLNDLYRLSDSVFNDDNFNAVLTGFDMLVLRVYNNSDWRSGMTRAQAAATLPGLLSRLNPRGNYPGRGTTDHSPRAWISAIETALGRNTSGPRRIGAARMALSLAQSRGWQDNRLAFSYFALGRLTLVRDPELSLASFLTAGRIYSRIAPGGIQEAHVNMQLAAFALSSGQADQALALTGAAMPAATRAENASLLATLLMIRAEALDLSGRPSEARAVRLDSLRWGRYGFGRTEAVRARMTEVAALSPDA